MKTLSITRKVDELGRIVIPIELRRTLDLKEKDPIDIYTEGEFIILRKGTEDNIGIVRKVDELGRIVLPIELRRNFELAEGDAVEVNVDGDEIVLKKYVVEGKCAVTGTVSRRNKLYAGVYLSETGVQQMLTALKNA